VEAKLRKGATTRQSILEAAIVRFGRDGFRATALADIARDAGVGATVPYAYFTGKEALFLAAVDEDVARLIREGLAPLLTGRLSRGLASAVIEAVLGALERHPLARRLLAGLEPEVTERVLEVPALVELRKACVERVRSGQLEGTVRPDVDAALVGTGLVTITLSLLMSVVQIGGHVMDTYGDTVIAVLEAALAPSPPAVRGASAIAPPSTRGARSFQSGRSRPAPRQGRSSQGR
jgi:AcrR family transcriptional regulator